jgi:hypothetical protein
MWEQAKADGLGPAIQPAWAPVAMLCDLSAHLWATAADVEQKLHR